MTARLPEFLIIGAMKAGTTTLWDNLARHPRVYLPQVKEPHSLLAPDAAEPAAVRRYSLLFASARRDQICGEASTGYSKLPRSRIAVTHAQRILGSGLRLIYMVRDPVARALSHHAHLVTSNEASADFEQAVAAHPEILEYGLYAKQLAPWLEAYGAGRIRVVRLEELRDHRVAVLNDLCDFLGIEPVFSERDRFADLNTREKQIRYEFPILNNWIARVQVSQWYKVLIGNRLPSFVRRAVRARFGIALATPAIKLPASHAQSLQDYFRQDQEQMDRMFPARFGA